MKGPIRGAGAILVCAVCCTAQELTTLPDGTTPTFGVTVFDPYGLRGQIYYIREGTMSLPNFKKLQPVGTIYTNGLNIPARSFTEGFPGITNRVEWFAIDYTGRFWIQKPGRYQFALLSDDGSKLYIDHKTVIDNDGVHGPKVEYGSVKLKAGVHDMRISYFQGPRYELALILAVEGEGEKKFRIFDTRNYLPPSPEN